MINYIYGLGGRDIRLEDIHRVYQVLAKMAPTGTVQQVFNYLTVRE
jgi:pyruvate ferredoxin oxidoreductase alpha subunit